MENFDNPYKQRLKKVSPEKKEYTERIEEVSRYVGNKVYGENFLHAYERMQDPRYPSFLKEDEGVLKERGKKLNKQFQDILIGPKSARTRDVIEFLARGILYSGELKDKVIDFIGGDPFRHLEKKNPKVAFLRVFHLEHVLANELSKKIKNGEELPTDMLALLVSGNKNAMESIEEELKSEYLPTMTSEFKSEVVDILVRSGFSAHEAEEALRRVDTLAVHVADGLSATLENMGGSYNESRNTVLIAAQYVTEEAQGKLKKILYHEYLHVLSGRLVYEKELELKHDSEEAIAGEVFDESVDYEGGRVGLRFNLPLPFDDIKGMGSIEDRDRFKWLNEAVTERLTVQMIEKRDATVQLPAYQTEMKILDHLCSQGKEPIDFQMFVQAYFEDYKPSTGHAVTIPAWRALRVAINKSFSSTFLVKLDNRIRKVGSEQVLKELEKGTFSI